MGIHILLSVSCGILAFIALFANLILGDGGRRIMECGTDGNLCNPFDLKPCCNNDMHCKVNLKVGYFVCTEKEIQQDLISGLLGMPCDSDADCNKVIHAKCSKDNKCACRENNIQLNETTCAPQLGKFCWKNEKCATDNSVCINNECQCQNNYFSVSNHFCWRKILRSPCNDDLDCVQVKNSKCNENKFCECTSNTIASTPTLCSPIIDGSCSTNNTCVPDDSICVENKCKCKPHFKPSLSKANCEPIVSLGMICKDDTDCLNSTNHSKCSKAKFCECESNYQPLNKNTCAPLLNMLCTHKELCATDNSICIDNTCQCRQYYVYRGLKCVPTILGEICKTNTDCDEIDFSVCANNQRCVCSDKYVQANKTTCLPILNGTCFTDIECVVDNSLCINNKCRCKSKFEPISDKQCNPVELGLPCYDNFDCTLIYHSKCSDNNKCVCRANYVEINNKICAALIDEYCSKNIPCAVNNSNCVNNKCQCRKNFLQESNNQCLPSAIKKNCHEDLDCEITQNALCSKDKVCECRSNYVQVSYSRCAPLLGAFCEENDECAVTNSICVSHQCECDTNYLHQSNNQCLPTALGQSCTNNKDCRGIKYSICSKTNKCICQYDHTEKNEFTCAPLIGGYCNENNDCFSNKTICFLHRCICAYNYISVSKFECLPMILEKNCYSDNDCNKVYSYCSLGVCVCELNYVALSGSICSPLLSETCSLNDTCAIENAFCTERKCECRREYESHLNYQCIPSHLGGKCTEDIDCNLIKNSECSSGEKCICKGNYIQVNKTVCASPNGYSCLTNEDCGVQNSVCMNNECQCKSGYITVSSYTCIPVQAKKFCTSDDDCKNITHSLCSKSRRCVCKANYVEINNTKCASLLFNDCLKNEDCITHNSICSKNKCQCRPHYAPGPGNKCLPISLGMPCNDDSNCETIINSVCSDNKICICDKNNYAATSSTCLPTIGKVCKYDVNCLSEVMHCIDNKCQCKPPFIAVSSRQCVTKSSTFPCKASLDCGEPWHSECSKDKKCLCKINNVAINKSTCRPIIGGYCWKNQQCQPENSVCNNFQCKCKLNFIPVADNLCAPL